MTERRRSWRFDIRARITLIRTSSGPVSGVGETKNLGAEGVLFTSNLKIDIGEAVEYVIHLGVSGGADLHCVGRVLRVTDAAQQSQGGTGLFEMAVTLEQHTFVRRKP